MSRAAAVIGPLTQSYCTRQWFDQGRNAEFNRFEAVVGQDSHNLVRIKLFDGKTNVVDAGLRIRDYWPQCQT